MKKILVLLLCILLIAGALTSCSVKGDNDGKISIVTTVFPEYDWVRSIVGDHGDRVELTLLLDSGADLHSYQPTADDIVKISTCDLFIYVGGESDEWVKDVLKTAHNPDMLVINLMETLGDRVKEEEIKEGMEADHDHEHEHEHEVEHDHDEDEHDHEHEEETEYDEHVWLSLKNAAILVERIADKIKSLDPENADSYASNAAAYVAALNALDARYEAAVAQAPVKTLLFGDRFPFRYLTDDYGLDYYAAFVGCSAESEASFETVVFLASKVDELGLQSILQIESSDGRITETIKQQTRSKDQTVRTLDSMQSVTAKDVKKGTTYIDIMESNLDVLIEALK